MANSAETPASAGARQSRDAAVDFSPEAIAALEIHPDFPAILRQLATATVEGYRSRWSLNRLLNDGGRFIASLMIIDLHFHAGQGKGFTAAQLRRDAVASGLCSGGRITALLASLRLSGFLTDAPSNDGRVRQLIPTQALLAPHRARWAVMFDLIARLRPEARGAAQALEDPAFLAHCAHVIMSVYRSGERLFTRVPELHPIGERDAGITMLLSLLVLEPDRSITVTELARCFSISRSHVRETLRLAEQSDLAVALDERGHFGPGPRLAPVIGRFYALLFTVYVHAFVLAAERGFMIGEA